MSYEPSRFEDAATGELRDRAELAERQRDEAVALLRGFVENHVSHRPWTGARAFLASFPQGGEE